MEKFFRIVAIIFGPPIVIFFIWIFFKDPGALLIGVRMSLMGFGTLFLIFLLRVAYYILKEKITKKRRRVE